MDEEGVPGQHEGTMRPSKAKNWGYAFDLSSPYDLALVFGEATLASGRILPAKIHLGGLAGDDPADGPQVIEIHFAPPSVADSKLWQIVRDDKSDKWRIRDRVGRGEAKFVTISKFAARHPDVFPLIIRTYVSREAGRKYALQIGKDGRANEVPTR